MMGCPTCGAPWYYTRNEGIAEAKARHVSAAARYRRRAFAECVALRLVAERALADNRILIENLTSVQTRCTELVEELRAFRGKA